MTVKPLWHTVAKLLLDWLRTCSGALHALLDYPLFFCQTQSPQLQKAGQLGPQVRLPTFWVDMWPHPPSFRLPDYVVLFVLYSCVFKLLLFVSLVLCMYVLPIVIIYVQVCRILKCSYFGTRSIGNPCLCTAYSALQDFLSTSSFPQICFKSLQYWQKSLIISAHISVLTSRKAWKDLTRAESIFPYFCISF